jgi:predicted amidohydrolase YtcJ
MPHPPSAPSPSARLFTGGSILTLDDPPWVEALVVTGDRIAAVGSQAEREARFPDAERLEARLEPVEETKES